VYEMRVPSSLSGISNGDYSILAAVAMFGLCVEVVEGDGLVCVHRSGTTRAKVYAHGRRYEHEEEPRDVVRMIAGDAVEESAASSEILRRELMREGEWKN
jgi:hypothetical protein